MSSSNLFMASLASISVARSCGVPLGKMLSLSMLVLSSIDDKSSEPATRRSSKPGPGGKPSTRRTEGRATSASTSITVLSSSAAILIAKLIAVKLLPSPGTELVTMIRLPLSITAPLLPIALLISGRLSTRYWSAMRERGALGLTMPAAAKASRSISTRWEVCTCF